MHPTTEQLLTILDIMVAIVLVCEVTWSIKAIFFDK